MWEAITSRIILTQLWELKSRVRVQETNDGAVQVLSGTSSFFCSSEWLRIYAQLKIEFCHRVTLSSGLHKEGLISRVVVTKEVQI